MKLSISLPERDVARLDRYVAAAGLDSRSAAIQAAIRQIADSDLEADYAAAWDEWAEGGSEAAWAGTAADGLADASR